MVVMVIVRVVLEGVQYAAGDPSRPAEGSRSSRKHQKGQPGPAWNAGPGIYVTKGDQNQHGTHWPEVT